MFGDFSVQPSLRTSAMQGRDLSTLVPSHHPYCLWGDLLGFWGLILYKVSMYIGLLPNNCFFDLYLSTLCTGSCYHKVSKWQGLSKKRALLWLTQGFLQIQACWQCPHPKTRHRTAISSGPALHIALSPNGFLSSCQHHALSLTAHTCLHRWRRDILLMSKWASWVPGSNPRFSYSINSSHAHSSVTSPMKFFWVLW